MSMAYNAGMPFHVVLFEPEIPPNTGNIIRLCANTGAELHLVEPLGFDWDDKRLRRAGLDYHALAHVTLHADLQSCLSLIRTTQKDPKLYAFSTKGRKTHASVAFTAGDILLFGPETRGLPEHVLSAVDTEQVLRIPMHPESRSLNLANAVAIAIYEGWRQLEFAGAGRLLPQRT